ncbi:MAG: plasmid stabilization protein [Bacteroidetes bacterium CG_4_10_14_3_um_filter_31_20]|nr:type II toxin-antitoxin system RelE/ParE family toxin [Bacteroidota bacterium]PIY06992.1 MAG: plasmid stabilization protein [Bacteroidetes bacterium CG_4_10_14_3_um_filter_31_20]
MKVSFSKNFEKQLTTVTNPHIRDAIRNIIQKLIETSSLSVIPHIKKMKGDKGAYRIRIGDYRIGFYIKKTEIFISTVAHRKDIYKRFP